MIVINLEMYIEYVIWYYFDGGKINLIENVFSQNFPIDLKIFRAIFFSMLAENTMPNLPQHTITLMCKRQNSVLEIILYSKNLVYSY